MANFKEEQFIQALAHVARVGDWTLAKVARSDDAQKRTLTITFSGISAGFVQEALPYDDASTPLVAHANGRGEIVGIEGLQPGDLAETEALAEAEIAATQVEQLPDGEFVEASVELQVGEATDEPRQGTEVAAGETVEMGSTARRRR